MSASNKITINTGNVLHLVDIKKKAGQNISEELTESLKLTVNEWKKLNQTTIINGTSISRTGDDTLSKMSEEDRKDLKVGIKIFIRDSSISLDECLDKVYSALNIKVIDNVILAYAPVIADENGSAQTNDSESDANANQKKCELILPGLTVLWKTLEKYVKDGRILQVGVSDVEENCFKRLYEQSEIKPLIVQINLASCCVVPPGLQAFCKDNDIQLLTHSDPQEIISKESLIDVIEVSPIKFEWCARYQIHIKCRGVLAVKGFIVSACN